MRIEFDLENDSFFIQMNSVEADSADAEQVNALTSISGFTRRDIQKGVFMPDVSRSIPEETVVAIICETVEIAPLAEVVGECK